MNDLSMQLSALLDGELSTAEAEALQQKMQADPALQAEYDRLVSANNLALAEFAAMLEQSLPLALARTVSQAPLAVPANMPRAPRPWLQIAAALALAVLTGTGGYMAGQRQGAVQLAAADWVAEVATYHKVYAAQGRHLVEVPASESEHLVSWLSKETGVPFTIPDLSAQGLTFEGGRLLVAAGQPVGQLMYRDASGAVIALCFIASDKPASETVRRDLDGFDALIWGKPGARFIVIGPKGDDRLPEVARIGQNI
ncbi:anti-sigma factor family protein [Neogemmobacter tilapiae]|uniref:Membrane protein n=1 Tax=Neogemmobacter tilapiae TaxID=875041 RepID=A0A918TNI9_9RHOB|nr:anti-sigma factor [Gemmobacter tilapiae]GHC49936.1 membrane protein [Gemmobacter tilapiae]